MEQLPGEKILKKGYEPGQNSVCGKVKPRIDTIMGRWQMQNTQQKIMPAV